MDGDLGQNNREFTRIPIDIEVNISFEDVSIKAIETQNLSMKGLFVQTNKTFPVGSKCKISLCLFGQSDPLPLNLIGSVRRITEGGMSFEFLEIDVDTYSHLKNLILLNSSLLVADNIEREIGEHIGLNKRS